MDDLLDFIRQSAPAPVRTRPANFGVTVAEYAAAEKISRDTARKVLAGLVFERVLECRRMMENAGTCRPYVYARPGDWAKVV